jgi:hypothetical protein
MDDLLPRENGRRNSSGSLPARLPDRPAAGNEKLPQNSVAASGAVSSLPGTVAPTPATVAGAGPSDCDKSHFRLPGR